MGTTGQQRSYDRAFKERAVKLSRDRDNIEDLAAELGISPERIYKWRAEFARHGDASFQGHGVERLSDEGPRPAHRRKISLPRSKSRGSIFHSDRGVQYASEEFRNTLAKNVCRVCRNLVQQNQTTQSAR